MDDFVFFLFFGKSACCPERLTVCNAVKTCFRWLPEGHCMPFCVTNKGWRTKTPNTNCCTCPAGAALNFWSYVQSRLPLCTQHHIADSHSSLADMPHSPIFSRHSAKRSQFGRFLVGGKLFQSQPSHLHPSWWMHVAQFNCDTGSCTSMQPELVPTMVLSPFPPLSGWRKSTLVSTNDACLFPPSIGDACLFPPSLGDTFYIHPPWVTHFISTLLRVTHIFCLCNLWEPRG